MTLALRLGKTLDELLTNLTAAELKMWLAFNQLNPIGDWRGDVHAAQISTAILNSQGGKATINEMMLKWTDGEEDDQISGLEEWLGKI
jgi:hypothetical protein